MQIYWNKRKRLHNKRVQLPQDWFGTPTWPPFHCFGTPIWSPERHVKTIWRELTVMEESIHACIYLSIGLKVIVEYIDTYGQVTSVEGIRSVPTLRTKLAPLSYTCVEITQREQDALEFILSCAHLKCVLITERNRAETIYLFSIYCFLSVSHHHIARKRTIEGFNKGWTKIPRLSSFYGRKDEKRMRGSQNVC